MDEARTALAQYDYATAQNLLETIPADQRSNDIRDLLATATASNTEATQLLMEIKQGAKSKQFEGLYEKTRRLLELRPDRENVRILHDKLERRESRRTVAPPPLPSLRRLSDVIEAESVQSSERRPESFASVIPISYIPFVVFGILLANSVEPGGLFAIAIGVAILAGPWMVPTAMIWVSGFLPDAFQPPSIVDPPSPSSPPEITSKSTGMKLRLIPSGTFQMGSPASEADRSADESPQHTVLITQPFYMGVYEVTQAEYESVMGTNPSWLSKTGGGESRVSGMDTSKFPVETVSWEDAQEFCRKLSAKDGQTYRLPTEAEWEYACRAGTTTPFHFGSTLNGDKANVDGDDPYGMTTKGMFLKRTTMVGSYGANAFGLYDMHGNVWEWCEDRHDKSAYGKRSGTTSDPKVTSGSEYRVLRGGSWFLYSQLARSANRDLGTPGNRFRDYGFRVVLSASAVRTP